MATVGDFVVILVADVVGYPSLIEADEESILERLKGCRRQFVYPKIAEHNGRIVRTTDGSLLVEFASPPEAVRCAESTKPGTPSRSPLADPSVADPASSRYDRLKTSEISRPWGKVAVKP